MQARTKKNESDNILRTRVLVFILIFSLMTVGGLQVIVTDLKAGKLTVEQIISNFIIGELIMIGVYFLVNRWLNKKERKKKQI
jgi:hypothetical protein